MISVGESTQTAPTAAGPAADERRQWRQTAVLVAAIGLAVVAMPGRRGWFDVGVYHDAVVYWIHRPGHLYDFVRSPSPYGFTYPPFAALCMLPMAWLSWHLTVAINLVVSLVALSFVVHRLLGPIARDQGWPLWRAYAVAACLLAVFEPVRDTIEYGQINLILLALVFADLLLLEGRFARFAGIGTGLAAAIKLTPMIFIVYLLLSGRRRAAAVAAATMLGATALAAALAPTSTVTYFAKAIWDTNRIGAVSYVSNQSLMGLIARFSPGPPSPLLWLAAAAVLGAVWAWRIRAATRDGDLRTGFALTGVAACLLSPVTWLHHLVWLMPALTLMAASALPGRGPDRVRAARRRVVIAAYLLTGSGVVWIWWKDHSGVLGLIGSNLGVFASVALLVGLPVGSRVRRPSLRAAIRWLRIRVRRPVRRPAPAGVRTPVISTPVISTAVIRTAVIRPRNGHGADRLSRDARPGPSDLDRLGQ